MLTDYIYSNIIKHIINHILLLPYLRVRENVLHDNSLSYLLTKVNGTSPAVTPPWVRFVNGVFPLHERIDLFRLSLKINTAILMDRYFLARKSDLI